jgi:predicted nucleic acid-binding protein
MAASVLADASFLVALLSRRERDHDWAVAKARQLPPPWRTCEAALSETFYLLGQPAAPALDGLLRRGAIVTPFRFDDSVAEVLRLMEKYADVPMSFADACLVRMTETLADPMLLTTDADFRIYRRHSRQTVPCVTPG